MKSLFVGNLSFQTTESELSELFKPFGQVTRVNLVKDRETGRARGFAFVEMPNDEEAAKAIAGLDGKPVGGRNLKVNEARPKDASRPPRSSGGGGRRGASPVGSLRNNISWIAGAQRHFKETIWPSHSRSGRRK
ncbi:MAG: RNA-binding protein [Candidatus Acidiferrum sp.]